MDIEKLKNELTEMINKGRAEAEKVAKAYSGNQQGVCVTVDNKKYVNPKHLSFKEYYDIVSLCEFVKKHPEVNNDILDDIFRTSVFYFGLLKDLKNRVQDLVEEIGKSKNEIDLPLIYSNYRFFNKSENVESI